jgi:hypothetical protein
MPHFTPWRLVLRPKLWKTVLSGLSSPKPTSSRSPWWKGYFTKLESWNSTFQGMYELVYGSTPEALKHGLTHSYICNSLIRHSLTLCSIFWISDSRKQTWEDGPVTVPDPDNLTDTGTLKSASYFWTRAQKRDVVWNLDTKMVTWVRKTDFYELQLVSGGVPLRVLQPVDPDDVQHFLGRGR